jgi:hypothetical protein
VLGYSDGRQPAWPPSLPPLTRRGESHSSPQKPVLAAKYLMKQSPLTWRGESRAAIGRRRAALARSGPARPWSAASGPAVRLYGQERAVFEALHTKPIRREAVQPRRRGRRGLRLEHAVVTPWSNSVLSLGEADPRRARRPLLLIRQCAPSLPLQLHTWAYSFSKQGDFKPGGKGLKVAEEFSSRS